ncbi:MAG: MASE1 domain-containing protein, partial [Candidatus Binatia bacterium]
LALAALLVWGYRLWPGIFLGAFLVNITTQGSVPTTLGIATGNTVEALLGAWLVCRFANGVNAFESAKNIFKFVLLAALLSTAVSATLGVTSLTLGGFARWEQYPAIWLTWWLGDMAGSLIVAPLLVIWMTQPLLPLESKRIFEWLTLLATVIVVGQAVFLGEIPSGAEYLTIPALLWAAFRFGERGAVTSTFVMSAVALVGTLQGFGPFKSADSHMSLLLLQAFIGSITITVLVLAAVVGERKRAEEAVLHAKNLLANANEELENRVQERTYALEQAQAALIKDIEEHKRLEEQLRQSQKLESIGTLAAGVAHDFNNILNIIKGYASFLADPGLARGVVHESLKVIDEAIERGTVMVRQLLMLARKTDSSLAPVSVNDVIAELSQLLRQTLPKTIDISLDLDPRLPAVMADQNQIKQALLNLCVNARDAMPAGGRLTLRTAVAEGVQSQDARGETGDYARIEVTDTGSGIEKTVRARIFEPFFTTKPTGEGTGLGLSIVYGIVKNHQGFIDVETRLGHGTAFRLYLPIVTADEPLTLHRTNRKPSGLEPAANGGGTILVVEDEAHMVRLLKNVLIRHGYQVLTASDGEEALDLYRRRHGDIDVVLLDIGLPKIDGWDVMLRMKEENPAVKIIVASGYIEPELRSAMNRAGIRNFFYKPYALERIVEAVQAMMETP